MENRENEDKKAETLLKAAEDRFWRYYDLNREWESTVVKHLVIANGGGAAGVLAYLKDSSPAFAQAALFAFGAGLMLAITLVVLTYKNTRTLQRVTAARMRLVQLRAAKPEILREPIKLHERENHWVGFVSLILFVTGSVCIATAILSASPANPAPKPSSRIAEVTKLTAGPVRPASEPKRLASTFASTSAAERPNQTKPAQASHPR